MSIILAQFLPYIISVVAAVVAIFGWGKKKERDGREKERIRLKKEIDDAGTATKNRIDKALADSDITADTAAEWLRARHPRK